MLCTIILYDIILYYIMSFCLLDSTVNFKYVSKFENEIFEEILKGLGIFIKIKI